jgi:hypothetical protein
VDGLGETGGLSITPQPADLCQITDFDRRFPNLLPGTYVVIRMTGVFDVARIIGFGLSVSFGRKSPRLGHALPRRLTRWYAKRRRIVLRRCANE